MKYNCKWEDVDHTTKRMMVPGGWLVRSFSSRYIHNELGPGRSVNELVSTVYVPDKAGEWII